MSDDPVKYPSHAGLIEYVNYIISHLRFRCFWVQASASGVGEFLMFELTPCVHNPVHNHDSGLLKTATFYYLHKAETNEQVEWVRTAKSIVSSMENKQKQMLCALLDFTYKLPPGLEREILEYTFTFGYGFLDQVQCTGFTNLIKEWVDHAPKIERVIYVEAGRVDDTGMKWKVDLCSGEGTIEGVPFTCGEWLTKNEVEFWCTREMVRAIKDRRMGEL